ncbi:MAG: hypothetical protein J5I90_14740 [Caldilineales bacterium]|nr:hypothetical protein [Caldilineales bacterium]
MAIHKNYFGILVLLITLVVVVACSPSLVPPETTVKHCEWLDEPQLRALGYGDMTTEDAITWFREQHGLSDIQMENAYPEGAESISWFANNKEYYALFFEDKLRRVEVSWNEPLPTGDNILDCFGQPSYYNATFTQDVEAMHFALELWYPEQGLSIAASIFTDSMTPPAVSGEIGFGYMSISKPGDTVDQLLSDMIVLPEAKDWVLSSLWTWPNDWEAIESVQRTP